MASTRYFPFTGNVGRALLAGAACGIVIVAPWHAFAQSIPSIKPNGSIWETGAGFRFDKKEGKTRRSVSGMACSVDAGKKQVCLLAFDEGREARYATLVDKRLDPGKESVMLRSAAAELDAEGAATDGKYFYVAGSHSAKRSDCKSNPASRHVIRFRLDPSTGQALREPAGNPNTALAGYEDTDRLWSIMQALPELQGFVGEQKCLGSEPAPEAPTMPGRQGVNIEGLGVKDKRLYFGFRGPVEQGVAKVLSVDTEALFRGGDPKATVTRLALGARRGIRDIVATRDGFLLLAGPDDSPSSSTAGWTLSWWDGKDGTAPLTPKVLAVLDTNSVKLRSCDKELKPEAITVLEEGQRSFRVLVLSDGMCDGGPLEFTVLR